MQDASASHNPQGINGINKVISQLRDEPLLNIKCQLRSEIRDVIHRRFIHSTIFSNSSCNWIFMTAQEWRRWLPSKTKQDFLNAGDPDQQILKSLGAQFVGPKKKHNSDHLGSLFMSKILCNLNLHEQYFYYMHKLLITSGNAGNPSYLKYYLRSFHGYVE